MRNKRTNVSPIQTITTRDPVPVNRDPQPSLLSDIAPIPPVASHTIKPRRYIAASMPCVCPTCGHNTRMADGRHVDPVRARILEYRTCIGCGALLAAGRPMTEMEKSRLCIRAEAVAEYEETVKQPD